MPCTTITIEEPEPDKSEVEIRDYNANPSGDNSATISYTVSNVIVSGSGEQVTADVNVTDGNSVLGNASHETALQPGETRSFESTLDGLSGGEMQICVEATKK